MPDKEEKTKVFVIDDSVMARNMLIRILATESSIEVVGEAGTGQSAILLLDSIDPDIAILEASLGGGMDLGEVAYRMKEAKPDIKIILVADTNTPSSVAEYYDYGVCDVVKKPYISNKVLKAVEAATQ
ncbi:MAG: response regulator [Clostridiales bacterium]|jgi:DNA-binding NarL/FixJ family response regulator|nr:response regulator [Clostridiales bacterium]